MEKCRFVCGKVRTFYLLLRNREQSEFDEIEHQPIKEIEWSITEGVSPESIKKAMDVLSSKQRMAMLMWAYQDMTAEEVGLAMGMNKNSVDQLLYRAKLKLKMELEKGESHASE